MLHWETLTLREQGYLVGVFIGDGNIFVKESTGTYRIRFFFSLKRDGKIVHKVSEVLQKLLEFHKVRIYEDLKSEQIVEVHSKELLNKVSEFVYKKTLISLEFPSDFIKGILEGLIDSDGHVRWKRAEVKTASKILLGQIASLLTKLGITYKTYSSISHWSGKPVWRIYFPFIDTLFPTKYENQ